MTLEEARKVAEIASECDGGCGNCVSYLHELLTEAFPEFEWTYPVAITKRFEPEYGEPFDAEADVITVEPRGE